MTTTTKVVLTLLVIGIGVGAFFAGRAIGKRSATKKPLTIKELRDQMTAKPTADEKPAADLG